MILDHCAAEEEGGEGSRRDQPQFQRAGLCAAATAGGGRAGEESAQGGESEKEEGGRAAMEQVCVGE